MKIDRLIGILMLLINKDKITAKSLAEHFNVSVRTIQRDIDTLTLASVPIYADVGVKGGYQLLDGYKIDKNYLNRDEATILSSFLKSLEQAAPYEEVKSIYNKFLPLTGQEEQSKFVIKLNPNMNSNLFRKHLSIISKARDTQKKIRLKYLNMDFQETTRIVCPHVLVMYTGAWYLYAYCLLRDDFRMFKLYRIVDCEMLGEDFELQTLPEPLPWDRPIDTNRQTTRIKLEIDKVLQGKLPDYFNPYTCEILEDKILVTLDFPVDEWVYSLLMGLIPHVKIIEPDFLRHEFLERLKKSLNMHNYDI